MPMKTRHPRYNAKGSIDLEIEHPVFGWIPFTATPNDPHQHGREIYNSAVSGKHGEIAAYVEPEPKPMPVPAFVGPLQIRRALRRIGEMGAVKTFMETSADDETVEAWEYASEFHRDDPLIASVQVALGKTDEEVDDLFRLAATL